MSNKMNENAIINLPKMVTFQVGPSFPHIVIYNRKAFIRDPFGIFSYLNGFRELVNFVNIV